MLPPRHSAADLRVGVEGRDPGGEESGEVTRNSSLNKVRLLLRFKSMPSSGNSLVVQWLSF